MNENTQIVPQWGLSSATSKAVLDYNQLQKPKSTFFSICTVLKPIAF